MPSALSKSHFDQPSEDGPCRGVGDSEVAVVEDAVRDNLTPQKSSHGLLAVATTGMSRAGEYSRGEVHKRVRLTAFRRLIPQGG